MLEQKLKEQIISQLRLEEVKASDINDEAPLFGDGLGLDSIDALELIVLLEKEYRLKLGSAEEGKTVFHSVRSMADYIRAKQAS